MTSDQLFQIASSTWENPSRRHLRTSVRSHRLHRLLEALQTFALADSFDLSMLTQAAELHFVTCRTVSLRHPLRFYSIEWRFVRCFSASTALRFRIQIVSVLSSVEVVWISFDFLSWTLYWQVFRLTKSSLCLLKASFRRASRKVADRTTSLTLQHSVSSEYFIVHCVYDSLHDTRTKPCVHHFDTLSHSFLATSTFVGRSEILPVLGCLPDLSTSSAFAWGCCLIRWLPTWVTERYSPSA
jgi:hypothetical protein